MTRIDTIYRPKKLPIFEMDFAPQDILLFGKGKPRSTRSLTTAYIEVPKRELDLRDTDGK